MNKKERFLWLIFPSLGVLIWMTVFLGVITKGSQIINADGDLALHVAVGNYILDTGKIPLEDVFSHTMNGLPYTPHEWLSEVLFAISNRIMGLDGAILLTALVISFAFWLTYKNSSRRSGSFVALLFSLFLTILASAIHWLARPHIFTFLLFALWLIVLERIRKGQSRSAWLLPLIMLFWVNLHGGYMTGIVTWVLFGVGVFIDSHLFRHTDETPVPGNFWRYYLAGGIAALVATLANPSGIGLWKTNFQFLSNEFLVNHTEEYLSPNFHNLDFLPFLIFVTVIVLIIGMKKGRVRGDWLIPSTAWLAMALYSARNIPLFVIISAPVMVEGLEDLLRQGHEKIKFLGKIKKRDENLFVLNKSVRGILFLLLVVVLVTVGLNRGIKFDKGQIGNRYDPEKFPVAAVSWLEENPQEGEVFNYYLWGGYLLLREWPDVKVFIDGKIDFYGEELTREYLAVVSVNPDWEEILQKYGVDWVIFPVNEPLSKELLQNESWYVVYEDTTSLIVRRK